MKCPECESLNLGVVDSRGADNDGTPFNYVRRRRECLDCEVRFTTYELTEKEIDRMKAGEEDLKVKLLEILIP